MKITIKLFATFREGRFEEEARQYVTETTVRQVAADLNIAEAEVKIVFVNNRHAKMHQELHDGDVLAFFPPIGGG